MSPVPVFDDDSGAVVKHAGFQITEMAVKNFVHAFLEPAVRGLYCQTLAAFGEQHAGHMGGQGDLRPDPIGASDPLVDEGADFFRRRSCPKRFSDEIRM